MKYIDTFATVSDKLMSVDNEYNYVIELVGVNFKTGGAIRDTSDPSVHIDSMMLLIPFITAWPDPPKFMESILFLTDGVHWGKCTIEEPLEEDFKDVEVCVMLDLDNPHPDWQEVRGLVLSVADGEKMRAIYADYMTKLDL